MRQVFIECLRHLALFQREFLLLTICLYVGCSASEPPPFLVDNTQKPLVIPNFETPTAICTDGTYHYVANMGKYLLPVSLDGDGYISKITPSGRIIRRKFLTGLDAPSDLMVVDSMLLMTDVDRIKGFTLSSGEQILDISFLGGTINNMAYDGEEFLYVTARFTNRIYRTSLKTYTSQLLTEEILSPNGITYDPASHSLYISQFFHDGSGNILNYSLKKNKVNDTGTTSYHGFLDGLSAVTANQFLFTDWHHPVKAGKIGWGSTRTSNYTMVDLHEYIQNPTDVFLDTTRNFLWVIDLTGNRVVSFSVQTPTQ